MEYYNTKATREEIENGVTDEFGVIYSKDGKRLLENSSWEVENYTIHPGTEVICDGAFKSVGWVKLDGIKFPNSLRAIGKEAFVLTILNNISLPHGLISIGEKAFIDSHLTSIELPETLESIGDYAFEMNDGLQSIKIPSSVIHIGLAPLAECNHLKKISVDKNNQYFIEKNGLLSDYKQTRIIQVVPSNTKNLQLSQTFMYCDTGAFSSTANLDFIPKKFKGRWLLQSYKEHILRIIDRPCGVLDIGTLKYTDIVSLKFSNSLYCNMIESQVRNKSVLLVGDNLGVNVLLSALGFTKKKIKIYTQLVKEVLITKKNYKEYMGSYLSEDLTVKKSLDVVNEETGEVEERIINHSILERDTELAKGLLEELLEEYDALNATLENWPGVNYCHLMGPISRYKEVNQAEAIERLQKYATHLISLPLLTYKEDIGKAIIDGWERFESSQYEGFADKVCLDNCWPNACPEDDINWTGLVEEFFDKKGQRIRMDDIKPKRLWSEMKTFFLSKNVPDYRVEQFIAAFSHLSFNKSLMYVDDICTIISY